jgi:predicted DNA-binding transcriptional regulator AlpA
MENAIKPRILRKHDAERRVGISYPTIWRLEKAGLFPPRFRLSAASVGYFLAEVDALIDARAQGASDDDVRELIAALVAARKVP